MTDDEVLREIADRLTKVAYRGGDLPGSSLVVDLNVAQEIFDDALREVQQRERRLTIERCARICGNAKHGDCENVCHAWDARSIRASAIERKDSSQ